MIKPIYGTMPMILDIRTKDGRQVFRGEVSVHEGSFIDTDNAKSDITRDDMSMRYICRIEVQ